VQQQLRQVREKLEQLTPVKEAEGSRPGVPKLSVQEIATNLAEVRDARRARQMTPPAKKK
jgi:hypothetical protein